MSPESSTEALRSLVQGILENSALLRGPHPAVLYHYTSADGMAGILNSQSLWMTDIRYMNDLSELQYATALLIQRLERRMSVTGVTARRRAFLRSCTERLDSLLAFGPAVFSASFCEDGNLLSQWRAYRGRGGGYAVGFDLVHTLRFLSRPCLLRKMVYDTNLQSELLDLAIEAFLLYVDTLDDDPESLKPPLEEFGRATLDILLSLKHPSFEEELEWRLIYMGPGHPRYERGALTPKIRTFDGNIIPYFDTSFAAAVQASKDDTYGVRFPISHVRIGPTVNAELNRESVKQALLGIAPDVEHRVTDSGIPLRWL